MYGIGDYVVKANTGICRIEEIARRCLTEEAGEKEYYCMVPEENQNARLFVPVDSETANLRRAMSEEEAWELIYAIPGIPEKWIENDKSREQEYKNAGRSNDPVALVSIIKNLYLRNQEREIQGKKVTAVDDRYFKMAENALYSELAHALHREKESMRELIAETIEGRKQQE